jgi:hypothetical protein
MGGPKWFDREVPATDAQDLTAGRVQAFPVSAHAGGVVGVSYYPNETEDGGTVFWLCGKQARKFALSVLMAAAAVDAEVAAYGKFTAAVSDARLPQAVAE